MQNHLHKAVSGTSQHAGRSTAAEQQCPVLTEDSGYVIGVDIGGTNLRLAVADMTGKIVAKWSESTANLRGPDAVINLICDGAEQSLRQVSAAPDALQAIAVGAPGVTDVENGIVIATSYLMGWRNVPLRARLTELLAVPAAVDNDVNLAALGESWIGAAKDTQDFVFLAIGTGIGAGIMVNGRPMRGCDWAAGEIGYMHVPGAPELPRKDGEPGALESMIGGEGIQAQWRKHWSADSTTLAKELTATQIFDHALAGDPLAQVILQQSARMLSHAIYNISLVLNCPLIVLGGGVGAHPALCDVAQNILDQWSARGRLRVIRSALGADAQLFGAVRMALDTANAYSASLRKEDLR